MCSECRVSLAMAELLAAARALLEELHRRAHGARPGPDQSTGHLLTAICNTFSGISLVVDRSTTEANPVDWVETGWTHPQARGLEVTPCTDSATLPR
jgi:hypothetical protein